MSDAHPMLPGETWEEYARRLERRIKNQRDHIESLIAQQHEGNRRLRLKLARAERAIGRACIAAERRKEQRDTVIADRDRLRVLLQGQLKPSGQRERRYAADPRMKAWYVEADEMLSEASA